MTKQKKEIIVKKKDYFIFLVCAAFLIIGFISYSNILSSPFVLDDFKIISENSALQRNSIFTDVNMLRYIGYVTFALNYKINKLNTFGYHLLNIIIHIINAVLVFVLFRKVYLHIQQKRDRISSHMIPFFIALIFLVHPVQTQSVTYMVQRFTSLAALFTLVSLIAYFNFRTFSGIQYKYLLLSVISALLAFKTKENTATIPLMIILIEWLLFRRSGPSLIKKIIYVLPFFVLIAVIPLSFMNLHQLAERNLGSILSEFKETSYEAPHISRIQYLVTEFSVVVLYMRLLVFPVNQSMHYLYPFTQSFLEFKTLLSFCVIAGLLASAIIISKKYKEISFGIFWFFIFLLVESSIIPIQDAIFEHRLYLPSIGFIGAVVYLLFLLLKRFHANVFLVVMILIAATLAIAAYKRNEIWRDEIALWKSVIKQFPQDYIAHSSLGNAYGRAQRWDQAVSELKIAININPVFAPAHNNIAVCYIYKNLTDDAIKEYKIAIDIRPDYVKAYYNLASLYYKEGNFQEAFRLLKKAKSIDNLHAMVNNQLARLYCQMADFTKSMSLFNEALRMEPDNTNIHFNYGACLLAQRKPQEARAHFFKILDLDPKDIECYYFIAASYEMEQYFPEAVHFYKFFLSKSADETPYVKDAKTKLTALTGSSTLQ